MNLIAQVDTNVWNAPSGSTELYIKLAMGVLLGLGLLVGLMFAPTRSRKYIVGAATFVSGLIYVLVLVWPKPMPAREEGEIPNSVVESVGFALEDLVNIVGDFSNILTAFLLGLGIYSLLRIHSLRLAKMQKDWFFSLILLVSLVAMALVGFIDWNQSTFGPNKDVLSDQANWGIMQYARDLMFDGLLQEMDAALFSIIAFYILSAAYRAFRIRSIEATILLCAALIVMVSLMGAVEYQWGQAIERMTGANDASFLNNFKLTSISNWLRDNVQNSSLRAIQFGIGIGALAMGIRLWLSLERGGVRS